MAANAKTAAGSAPRTPPLEAGTYPARLVQVIDLGVQEQRPYQGQEKPPAQEISLTYELLDEFLLDEDGQEQLDKPRWVSERFVLHNLASEKAKSTKRYTALDPEELADGDFFALVNTPVNVTIVQNPGKEGRIYNNVAGISPMRSKDAERAPALVNEPRVFDLDAPDMAVFEQFPDWIKEVIKSNLNYAGSALQYSLVDGSTSDEPDGDDAQGPEDNDNPF